VQRLESLQRRSSLRHEVIGLDPRWRLTPQIGVVGLDLVQEAAPAGLPVLDVKGPGKSQHNVADGGAVAQAPE